MSVILGLMKRNIKMYLRDKVSVFFSILSMLIVLALMVIFLGKMNSENVVDALAQFGGVRDVAADEKNAAYLIQMWTLAGILEVNAVTITLTVIGIIVQDEAKGRLASFYLAPVKRIQIALGYITAAWIVGTVMCTLTLVVGELYMAVCGHPLLAAADWMKLIGMMALNTLVYASLSYLLALFIHSESAWSSIFTIIGTLVGFVGAIYLPMSMLPDGVGSVLKCLPVLHGAAMMREVCTADAIAKTFDGLPSIAGETFREQMGVSVMIHRQGTSAEIVLHQQILFLIICAIIAVAVSVLVSKRRRLRDR
ncbi:MAG: ABC transporter permease [Lachnospiraceae bacterium]|nr:ABC transporter permease [Lachnospiraceae bacterium]